MTGNDLMLLAIGCGGLAICVVVLMVMWRLSGCKMTDLPSGGCFQAPGSIDTRVDKS